VYGFIRFEVLVTSMRYLYHIVHVKIRLNVVCIIFSLISFVSIRQRRRFNCIVRKNNTFILHVVGSIFKLYGFGRATYRRNRIQTISQCFNVPREIVYN